MSTATSSIQTHRLTPLARLALRVVRIETIVGGLGVALVLLGAGLVGGGLYNGNIVKSQLSSQKIFFPAKGTPNSYPDLNKFAGKQVTNSSLAKIFADRQIGRDLNQIGGGKTYSEISAQARQHPSPALTKQTELMFRGTSLRGMLLNAWGWGTLGTVLVLGGGAAAAVGLALLTLTFIASRSKRAGLAGS